MSNDCTTHWGDDIYLSWQETILFLLNRPALRRCTKRPNLIEKHCCQLPIVHLKHFVQSFPSDIQNILYKSEAFHLGPFLLQHPLPAPVQCVHAHFPWLVRIWLKTRRNRLRFSILFQIHPGLRKNLIARHQDYLVCLKSKPMKCYLRHQMTGESLGGVLIFFPWVCNSQNATQFLESDLEKGKGFREKRFYC